MATSTARVGNTPVMGNTPVTYKGLLYLAGAATSILAGLLAIHSQVVIPNVIAKASENARSIVKEEMHEHISNGVHKGAITTESLKLYLDPIKDDIRDIKEKLDDR